MLRKHYIDLREILRMLESHFQLTKLSETYVTLKSHIHSQLSLLKMRKKIISLKSEKMTTAVEKRKKSDSSIEQIFTKNLIFFDLKDVFQSFLFFKEYRNKMHIEMIHFVDAFSEF